VSEAAASKSDAPQISVTPIALRGEKGAGLWATRWRGQNHGASPLQLLAVHFPHGQFKSVESKFEPAIALGPGECAEFEVEVTCRELPGGVIENAFLIVNAVCSGSPWRIFVRLRVTINGRGEPEPCTRSITVQRVGFSSAMRARA
jgi:hypothetical protein